VSSTQEALPIARAGLGRSRQPSWRPPLHGVERIWAVAFIAPYALVALAFAVFPVVYGLWFAGDPAIYAELFDEDEYWDAAVTTLFYVGIGVSLTMLLSLALSGFFMRRRWWSKALLVLSMFPWALPSQPAFISYHWMLIYPGFIDALSWRLFGVDGPDWFNHYWPALFANVIAYAWKTMPFWTLILLAGRMAIPQDLYDAAAVDGAGPVRRFRHLVMPLLANLFLVCTLLATIWMLGDFITPDLVSGGAPGGSTDVLATLGVEYTLEHRKPELGVATAMTALPILLLLAIMLIRRLRRTEVQL